MSNHSGSNNPQKDGLRIKTLFIRPVTGRMSSILKLLSLKKFVRIPVLRHDEILRHFSAFGDVHNVRICNETRNSYGFVTFTMAESAAKALGVDIHVIAGRRVKVRVADDTHQGKSSKISGPLLDLIDDKTILRLNGHRTTFLHLNDDCILEILTENSFNLNDLHMVAETCHRLKEIAGRVFRREHKTCDINSLSEDKSEPAKRILRNFGSVISDLRISGVGHPNEWSREMLDSITEYCSTLQSLDLQFFNITENCTTELRPLFKNLQKLTIARCAFVGASKTLFADCGSLVELEIGDCRDVALFILENTFPKLQQFEFRHVVGSHLLESFISRHKNLKSLKTWSEGESSVLKLIADCKRLDTLECSLPKNDNLDLLNLGHLKELKIYSYFRNFMEMVQRLENLKWLESLSLDRAKIDSEFVRTLSQLKQLQVLKLWLCTGLHNLNRIGDVGQLKTLEIFSYEDVDFEMVVLVQRLSKLSCLNLRVREFKLNLEKYLKIVAVVLQRPDKSKLTLRLACTKRHNYDNLHPHLSINAHLVEIIY